MLPFVIVRLEEGGGTFLLAGRVPGLVLVATCAGVRHKVCIAYAQTSKYLSRELMLPLLKADARPPALLACAPNALVLADARPPALLACASFALVLADARPPALLA
jgi:hypothetical protein